MFFFCVGDAVSQAAQSFLPSVIGRPSAAQRLGRQLMTTGVFVGIVNCAAAGTTASLKACQNGPMLEPEAVLNGDCAKDVPAMLCGRVLWSY